MSDKTFFEIIARRLSARRLRRFLKDKEGWQTVVRFRDCSFFAGGDNKIEDALLRGERHYDFNNFSAVTHFLRRGDVCFDVGANIGVYSVVFSRLSGDASNVHSFEPVDHIRQRLASNAKLNGLVGLNVNDFALGSEPGTGEMHQIKEGHFRGGTSTLADTGVVDEIGKQHFVAREVVVKTLDQYVVETRLARVDFVKIDVEGFELEVLKGASDTLSKYAPTIILEYDVGRLAEGVHTLRDLLRSHGYRAYDFVSFRDTLVLLPFGFDRRPIHRNILCWNPDVGR
jgi:FkbM family methyltransferase